MPYLIYPPESEDNNHNVYAVNSPDVVDEIVLQDLQSWGWRVVEQGVDDSQHTVSIQTYDFRTRNTTAEDRGGMPSLRQVWRREHVRRGQIVQHGGGRTKRTVKKEAKEPKEPKQEEDIKGKRRSLEMATKKMNRAKQRLQRLVPKRESKEQKIRGSEEQEILESREQEIPESVEQEIPEIGTWTEIGLGTVGHEGSGILVTRTIEVTLEEETCVDPNAREMIWPIEEPPLQGPLAQGTRRDGGESHPEEAEWI
ncbi:hypothetical protein BU26DRAFT_511793 [Trematosphaeria pertusa]|uniref:Uncharacterized protein n=1 Tax=Trematosphaeria pertusa TaxID=390896 RepID=A0A6A6HSW5_9PLEO|nr:uncharacterized protein BU26DRAFT_511793 [Trematosphaeria pertusa]KAF2240989.1 hypothetical protein BU26DRAFT_511793 [Trematosphaeria pertusa]